MTHTRDWNATSYARTAAPVEAFGQKLLDRLELRGDNRRRGVPRDDDRRELGRRPAAGAIRRRDLRGIGPGREAVGNHRRETHLTGGVTEQLLARLPDGRVIGVDGSASPSD